MIKTNDLYTVSKWTKKKKYINEFYENKILYLIRVQILKFNSW